MSVREETSTPYRGDRELARRVRAGDEQAFDDLFAAAFPRLCRFALVRVGGDAALAEEVAQATLCRAFDRLATYRGESSLATWLATICRHEIHDHFERLRRRAPVALGVDDPQLEAAFATLATDDGGPERELAVREVIRSVHEALAALPQHYAQALRWKYLLELPVLEIGSRLALSAKATESLLTRARQAFREQFATLAAASVPAPPRPGGRTP